MAEFDFYGGVKKFTPEEYSQWLKDCIPYTEVANSGGEFYVIVNCDSEINKIKFDIELKEEAPR